MTARAPEHPVQESPPVDAEWIVAEAPVALACVDVLLRVRFANASAHRLFGRRDGILVQEGRLRLPLQDRLEAQLRLAIAGDGEAADALQGAVHVARPSGARPYEVSVRIGSSGPAAGEPLGVLFIRDPEESAPITEEELRRRFGLTQAEARTALAVVQESGIEHAAGSLGLRAATVRGYLRQVFQKTGAHTQADLIRLVLCGGTRLRCGPTVHAGAP